MWIGTGKQIREDLVIVGEIYVRNATEGNPIDQTGKFDREEIRREDQ